MQRPVIRQGNVPVVQLQGQGQPSPAPNQQRMTQAERQRQLQLRHVQIEKEMLRKRQEELARKVSAAREPCYVGVTESSVLATIPATPL